MSLYRLAAMLALTLSCCALARGQAVDSEAISRKLCETTVTLRITVPAAALAEQPRGEKDAPENNPRRDRVIVQSGVMLGDGLIVTFSQYPPSAQMRVTLPDGGQAEAQVSVIDLYSGLSLLTTDQRKLAGLTCAESMPAAGKPILTAAASGLEQPVVSLGILGGVDRTLTDTHLPPLLQCDVRTTDTSSGAAVVDGSAKLVGIVAVTAKERQGWTYAVPVGHVQRLLRAKMDDKLVVLYQQRPSVGLTMVPGKNEGQVRVERVVARGPADVAGIKAGDDVLEVDGLKIRSVYQFVGLVLKKQPGDQMEFTIRQDGQEKRVGVTLGGGAIVDPTELVMNNGQLLVRSLKIERAVPGEVNVEAQQVGRDEFSLLQAQLARFATYIEKLRQDVRSRDEEIKALKDRLQMLERQAPATPKNRP